MVKEKKEADSIGIKKTGKKDRNRLNRNRKTGKKERQKNSETRIEDKKDTLS